LPFSIRRRGAALTCLLAAGTLQAEPSQRLPDLTVTATRSARSAALLPQAVTVLDRAAIEAANAPSTPDLLRGVVGVYIQHTNLGGGSPFLRGLTGKQVLILVDGVRVNNSFFRSGPHQYLNTLDPETIERIEVLRGPGSVLYGSDALGGVINIVTRPACAAPRVSGSLVGDTAVAGGAAGLRASHSGDALCLAGGATFKRFDDLDGGGDLGRQVPSAYDEWSADFAARYALSPQLSIGITQQFLLQYDVPKTSEVTLGSKAKFDYEPQTRSLTVLGIDGEFWGLDAVHVDMSIAWMEEGERVVDCAGAATPKPCAPAMTESVEVTEVLTLGTSSVFAKWFDAHRISLGHEYYGDRYGATKETRDTTIGAVTPRTPGRPDDTRYDSFGLFLQDEWSVSEHFELIPGLRYSRFEAEGSGSVDGTSQVLTLSADALTGSLQGRYVLTPAWNLVGGITQGFRAPNIEDFFPQVDFTSFVPNTDLEPESSLNYELGLKWNLGRASGELIAYWSEYEDLIARANTIPRQNRNLNEATIRGIEFAIETQVGTDWLARFNATYTHGDIRPLDPAECGGATSCPARRTPPLFGAATLRYAPASAWWVDGQLWFADRQDRLNPGDISDARIGADGTPGYAVWNLAAAWTPASSTRLQLTLENLGDREWQTHGSGLAAPGRSLRLSWRQTW
jgi:outer membrane receptor protein involved in Fe transport